MGGTVLEKFMGANLSLFVHAHYLERTYFQPFFQPSCILFLEGEEELTVYLLCLLIFTFVEI